MIDTQAKPQEIDRATITHIELRALTILCHQIRASTSPSFLFNVSLSHTQCAFQVFPVIICRESPSFRGIVHRFLPRIIIAEIIIYQLARFHTFRKRQAASSPFIIISIFVERSSTSQVIRHPVKIADSHPVILIAIHILNNARRRWSNRWRIIVIATRRQTSNSQAQKQNHGHFSNLFIYHIFHL